MKVEVCFISMQRWFERYVDLVPKSAFAKNTWLFILQSVPAGLSIEKVMEFATFAHLDQKIQLDSQIYFMVQDTDKNMTLIEMYQISNQTSLKFNEVLPNSFIWDRRGNLEGLELKVAYLEDPPFTYKPVYPRNMFPSYTFQVWPLTEMGTHYTLHSTQH